MLTMSYLIRLHHGADRIALLELLGTNALGPLQYMDDTIAPCPSIGGVIAVLSKDPRSACSIFCANARAVVNYAPNKSATLPLFDSPLPSEDDVDVQVVGVHKTLGVLFDSHLTFELCLKETMVKAWHLFLKVYHAGKSCGFPLPVVAHQVTIRVVPGVLYAGPLFFSSPRAEVRLNRLQQRWAKTMLGCQHCPGIKWPLLCSACGWDQRLGTMTLESAIMALARIRLLPEDHPASRMISASAACPWKTWLDDVRRLMLNSVLPNSIPDILEWPGLSSELCALAKACSTTRKHLLRRYRVDAVRPVLQQYDSLALSRACADYLPSLGFRFLDFQYPLQRAMSSLILFDLGPNSWLWLRTWNLVRMTGLWPAILHGQGDLLPTIEVCHACGQRHVDVAHSLCECTGSTHLFEPFSCAAGSIRRGDFEQLMSLLFGPAGVHVSIPAILFVGQAVALSLKINDLQDFDESVEILAASSDDESSCSVSL